MGVVVWPGEWVEIDEGRLEVVESKGKRLGGGGKGRGGRGVSGNQWGGGGVGVGYCWGEAAGIGGG